MARPLQPDPARGVFETLLVVDGVPVELDPHLARLRASVRALYGEHLPGDVPAAILARARGLPLGSLRVLVAPRASGGLRVETTARPLDPAFVLAGHETPRDVRSVLVEGWRGAHKWADRRPLDALEAKAEGAAPLLVDPDRGVLETTRANVFALDAQGVLRTPPADGAVLPGVTRALVLALAREAGLVVHEARLTLDDVREARELFLTGSLRGVEPVRSLDGATTETAGEVATALTDALRRRWLGAASARSRAAGGVR